MKDYKLDRSAFKIQTFKEADADKIFAADVPLKERLLQANYLISVAYGFVGKPFPRMDKTYFAYRIQP